MAMRKVENPLKYSITLCCYIFYDIAWPGSAFSSQNCFSSAGQASVLMATFLILSHFIYNANRDGECEKEDKMAY